MEIVNSCKCPALATRYREQGEIVSMTGTICKLVGHCVGSLCSRCAVVGHEAGRAPTLLTPQGHFCLELHTLNCDFLNDMMMNVKKENIHI